MSESPKAAFAFLDFRFVHFSFNEISNDQKEVSIDIKPSGKYYASEGIFEISLTFKAFEDDTKEKDFINVLLKAFYRFEPAVKFSEIPQYFYLNSIAILFPYLRAFISNLTLQANIKPLILPILNITGLEKPLMENTVEAD